MTSEEINIERKSIALSHSEQEGVIPLLWIAEMAAEIAYQLALLNESLHPLLREGGISSTTFEKEK